VSAVAAVILAHADAAKVRRLIAALDGVDVFLHCDRKTPSVAAAEMVRGLEDRVELVPRVRTKLASWSLVLAELAGVRRALERSDAEHIVVMSGSCYPLVSTEELTDELDAWRGLSRLELNPLPYSGWGSLGRSHGGMWRVDRRFLRYGSQLAMVRGRPIPVWPARIPDTLALHASAHWKIYARHHAQALLSVLDSRPDLVRFWSGTFVPEESCVASILRSHDLVGEVADEIWDDRPWFMIWPPHDDSHPRWLVATDYPEIRRAATLPPRRPENPSAMTNVRGRHRFLFARKIASAAEDLLNTIDDELRAGSIVSLRNPAP
jgi:hypothetical protein